MLQLRLMEKKRELVRRDAVDELIDQIAGTVLTALSSMPARCAPRGDLATRRSIERVVFEVRTEIAKVCLEMADKNGEPPLEQKA
jgi:phage terminase Nu1 subunit (DNA packaging protein)